MAILTREQLNNFNKKMLGLGAPVVIDGQGYNKYDFGVMSDFATKNVEKLTNRQLWYIAITLGKYKNTQLEAYKADLEETIRHYSTDKAVEVVGKTDTVVQIKWGFDKTVSEALKGKLDKSQYAWTKENGSWILNVKWGYVPTIIEEFSRNKLNCAALKKAYDTAKKPTVTQGELDFSDTKANTTTKKTPQVKKSLGEIIAKRSDKEVDVLEIASPYNKELVDLYKTIPAAEWDKVKKVWRIKIEYANDLYNGLPEGWKCDTIKKWAELVASWKEEYSLVDWKQYPLKYTPYEFQPKDAEKLLRLKVGLNGNEVGCGKTLEMVLVGESIPKKKLVICPATLRLNWEREIKMVNPKANVTILYSDKPYETVDGWNIISYNSLTKFQQELEEELFPVVIADEAHYIQAINNYGKPDSKRAWGVLRLAATAGWVFPVTGTPKTNRNKNLYNLLRMIRHPLTKVPRAFYEYGKTYCEGKHTRFGWDYNGNSNDEELNKLLKPIMVRHLKRDVLPNLKKQRQAIPVQVDLRQYNSLIAEYLEKRKNRNSETLVALNRAKQVVAIQKAAHSIEFAKEIIDGGEQVVIVTCYEEVVKKVEKAFKGSCGKIIGGMSDKEKQATIDQFQAKEIPVVVLNIVAGGVGITLTAASKMIINDVSWVPGDVSQAEGRIWRSGQTDTAMIYFMTAAECPMDEMLIDLIVYKSDTINKAIDGGTGESLNLRALVEKALVE